MANEKKDNLSGSMPPLPSSLPDNSFSAPSLPNPPFPEPPSPFMEENDLPLPSAMPPAPVSSGNAVAPVADYEKKFQEMEQARANMVKMLEEIQEKHAKERRMWEEKTASLQNESQTVLDEFASRQLKEEEQRAKAEADARNEKLKLEHSLKELESKLEAAREKTFFQALKTKEEEATSLKLEAAMRDVQLKNIREGAAREIEDIKIKLNSELSAKLLSLQKQYENKLSDIYVKSSQKEKELIEKVDNLQAEKESLLKQIDHEKESMRREFSDKNLKTQNEINLLVSRLDESKENYTKNLISLQGELASAKAQTVVEIANIKSEYEGRQNQLRKLSSELEGKIVMLNSQLESEKKIASENIRFRDEEISAIQKQFADRENLLKSEFENRIAQNTGDKNRTESELRQSLEKTKEKYSQKIAVVQDEKKAAEREILIKQSEFEKKLRESGEEQQLKTDELKKEYENKLKDKDLWQQKIENEYKVKMDELNNSHQRDVERLKENINIQNQLLLQERAKYENLLSERDKEILAAKTVLREEIEKQKEFYEKALLFKEEKIATTKADFEKKEIVIRSDFEKRLSETLNENVNMEVKFRAEIENLSNEFTKRLSISLEEKGKIEQDFRSRISFIEKEHLKESDLLKERQFNEIEKQKQEFQRKLDLAEISKNELGQKCQIDIEKRVSEFEKGLRKRDEEWSLKVESMKSGYESKIKQIESEKILLQQEIQKKIEDADSKWFKKLEDEKAYLEGKVAVVSQELQTRKMEYENGIKEKDEKWNSKLIEIEKANQDKIKIMESEKISFQQEIQRKTEEINSKWIKKLEDEKAYLEENIAGLSARFESARKQWFDESEKYKIAVSSKENELLSFKKNYEVRLAEMSRTEDNLKGMIEKLSDNLAAEREKFAKEIASKTKEFEAKMESYVQDKENEIRSIQRTHRVELKTVSIEKEADIAELKNEILSVQREKDAVYDKWMEEKKHWVNENIKRTERLSGEERLIILKKAELEALELKLKMNEKTVDARVDAEKRSYSEMYESKNEELKFLKEQLKKAAAEADEKAEQSVQSAETYKKVIEAKNDQLEFLKEQLAKMEEDIDKKIKQAVQSVSDNTVSKNELANREKELSAAISENKIKDEKIQALREDAEFKLQTQKLGIESEFSGKIKEIEQKYEHESEMIKSIAMKANAHHMEEIKKLKETIAEFESVRESQKVVAGVETHTAANQPAQFKEPVFLRIWHWLNSPV